MFGLVADAEQMAEGCVAAELPRRWNHVRAVAAKAVYVSRILLHDDADVLIASAWLHDVGYANGVVRTGLHSLDGGLWLLEHGVSSRIASLVAYHSCARFEAEERGLLPELTAQFVPESSAVADALWYSDMTTGPDGQDLTVRDRLSEIRERYGPEHAVTKFWSRAEPTLLAAVERTQDKLKKLPA